jgi:uncharacterized membrane protein YfcA
MTIDWAFVAAAVIATILAGLAKGGFSGVGMLATPVLALTAPPVEAAAILLPILIVQDAVSVWAFRNSWNRRIVAIMFPTAVLGVAAGWAFAEHVPVAAILGVVGLISVAFGLWRLWVERGGRIVAAATSPGWVGGLFGVALGFTSQVAHAGSPPFQIWVTPKQLPHAEFVGTAAILFALVNWVKVPAYLALGQFTASDLRVSAALLPVALISTFAGVWAVRRIHGRTFYTIVNLLMVGLGAKLMADAIL